MVSHSIDLLLINPLNRPNPPAYTPFGLLSIATYLQENGYGVKILDRNASREENNVRDYLKKYNPRAVGVSFFATGPLILDALKIIKEVKSELGKDIPIICGGLYPTLFPKQVLMNNDVDILVIGEGEITILELMQQLQKPESYRDIKGLIYKDKSGKIVENPPRPLISDLNDLPMNDWSLIDIPKYLDRSYYAKKVIVTMTSRGCPYRCAFCWEPIFLKDKIKFRTISAKKVIEELTFLNSKYKIDGIHFFDDNFDADKKRLDEICKLMKTEHLDIRWQHSSRVIYATQDRLLMEKNSGCEIIEYGVESGSPRMLDFIKKDQTVSQITKAFSNCKEVKIRANALIMIGMPTETIDDLKMTVNLIDSIPNLFTICNIYKPYPGSELFEYCINNGRLKLPNTMETMGETFGYTSTQLNMSEIEDKILSEVQEYFFKQNVIMEAKDAIKRRDFGRLIKGVQKVPLKYTLKTLLHRKGAGTKPIWK